MACMIRVAMFDEWLRNKRGAPRPYPLQEQQWDEAEGTNDRVLRGGAFYHNVSRVRCAVRYWVLGPHFRYGYVGFRVVSLPLHRTS